MLLDVRDECKPLFEFFYRILLITIYILVNNYEITTWEGFYLNLWSKDRSVPYISSEVFMQFLGVDDIPVICQYFNAFSIVHILSILSNR